MAIYNGKTVDEAIQAAETALGASQRQLLIKVKQEPRRGFLGIGRRPAIIQATLKQQPVPHEQPQRAEKRHSSPQRTKNNDKAAKVKTKTVQKPVKPLKNNADDPAVINARHEANLKRLRTAGSQLTRYLQQVFASLGVDTQPVIKNTKAHEITVDIKTAASGRVIGHHGRRINAMEQLSNAFMNYHGAPKTVVVLDTSDYRERRQQALHELAERAVTDVISSGQAVFLDPMPARERKQLHKELEDNAHVRTYSHGREPYRSVVIAPRN